MAPDLTGGSGKSTTPQTTQNRCYERDSDAASSADDGSGNGFYLPSRSWADRCDRCGDARSFHFSPNGRPFQGRRISRFTGYGFCEARHMSGGTAGSVQMCGCLGFEEAS